MKVLGQETFVGKILITDSPILPFFEKSAEKSNFDRYEIFDNFESMMAFMTKIPQKEKVVLFSPGGKSFDQYANYQARGDHFRQMVEACS